jgi:hypothetical protein
LVYTNHYNCSIVRFLSKGEGKVNRSKDAALAGLLRALGGTLGLLQADPVAYLQGGGAAEGGLDETQIQALIAERGSDEKIWGSMVKSTMQRRRPGFTESAYGYRSFRELVEDAQKHKLLAMVRDEKAGQYTIRLAAGED